MSTRIVKPSIMKVSRKVAGVTTILPTASLIWITPLHAVITTRIQQPSNPREIPSLYDLLVIKTSPHHGLIRSPLQVYCAALMLSVAFRAHLDTTTNMRGSAKRNAAFTLQHGAMLTPRQPKGWVPVVVSRCAHAFHQQGVIPAEHRQPVVHLLGVGFILPMLEQRCHIIA